MENAPVWLMNTMAKSGLFKRWQARKAEGHAVTYWQQGERGGWERKA